MRGFQPPPCSPIQGETEVTAAIFYEHADRSQVPTSLPQPGAHDTYCGSNPLSQTVPTYPIDPGRGGGGSGDPECRGADVSGVERVDGGECGAAD